jgi:hypothetical protein
MRPDPHSPEIPFEPSGGDGQDPVVQDFNDFFEKLSALDSLQWSTTPQAAPAAGPARTTAAQAAQAAPAARGTQPAKPRMTVVKSDRDLGAAPVTAEAVEAVARGRITARDVARFLKLMLVGLMLFALGLAAGWAALSLPGHFDRKMPGFAELLERTRAMTLPRSEGAGVRADALRVVESARIGAAAPSGAAQAANATPIPGSAQASATATSAAASPAASQSAAPHAATTATHTAKARPAARSSAPAAPAKAVQTGQAGPAGNTPGAAMAAAEDDSIATGEPETGFVIPTPGTVDEGSVAANPAGSTGMAASTDTAGTDTAGTGAAAGGPRFSLQVGACTSYACVENYRHLLLSKVGSRSIRVVTQSRGEGAAIQRIRIEPLAKAEGERLKAELAGVDPRFQDAYLIALH